MKSAAIAEREQADLRRRSDQLALEAALGWQPLPERAVTEPETKSVPTSTALRRKAAELGIAVPPTYLETVRAESRDLMLARLRGTDEQAGKR